MKAVLLVLSGDPAKARERFRKLYHDAEIQSLSRDEIENPNYSARLKALRARHPHTFAIATERLGWQRGQNALLLFGAIAGARRVVLFDMHDGFIQESRASILSRSP